MKSGFSPIKILIIIFVFLVLGLVAYITFPFAYIAIVGPQQQIKGNSMLPNLKDNQFVSTQATKDLNRADMVVFYHKVSDVMETEFTKRIIGLPGESIKIENGKTYINDAILSEPYLAPNITTQPGSFIQEGQSLFIPSNSYFIMGDNRSHSTDSREWGFIAKEDILRIIK